MSQVLVDSSVWVEMLRRGDSTKATQILGRLLSQGLVCTHGLIRAEILSGANSHADYRRLGDSFSALVLLSDPPDLWNQIAQARYHLARRGFQAAIADMVVAVTASHYGKEVLTLDAAFHRIKTVVPFKIINV